MSRIGKNGKNIRKTNMEISERGRDSSGCYKDLYSFFLDLRLLTKLITVNENPVCATS